MLSFCDTGHFGGLGDDVEAAAMTGDYRRWPTRLGTKIFYVLALEKRDEADDRFWTTTDDGWPVTKTFNV